MAPGIPSAASGSAGDPRFVADLHRELPSRPREYCGAGPRLPLSASRSCRHVSRHPPPAQKELASRSLLGPCVWTKGNARTHPPSARPRGLRLDRDPAPSRSRGAVGWFPHPGGWHSATWHAARWGRQPGLRSSTGSLGSEWQEPFAGDAGPAPAAGWDEGGPCDVFVATMPLDSPPLVPPRAMLALARAFPDALGHQAVILRSPKGECLLFDFRPRDSRDVAVILAALVLRPVPGSIRVRRLPRLPTGLRVVLHGQTVKGSEPLASAQQFCGSWDRGLVISRNDCRHFSRALVQLLLAGPSAEGAGQLR